PDKPNSRKILQTGSIPTENLLLRSHETKKTPHRVIEKKASRQELQEDIPSSSHSYLEPGLCSDDLINQLDNDTLLEWKSKVCDDGNVNFFLTDNVHGVAKYTVVVDSCSMEFTAYAFSWLIPDDHNTYNEHKRSIKSGEQFREVLSTVEKSKLCEVIGHSVPKKPSPKQFEATVFFRSPNCDVIIERSELCDPCSTITKQLKKTNKKRAKTSPAKSKAPLSACGPDKLRATVVAARSKCKLLEGELQELQKKITSQSVCIDKTLEEDILKIMDGQNLDSTPHMKFFWQEQMKLLQSSSCGRRYHPQIIRFALSVHGKSPSAYRELRESGALVLPSERVLRDYKNYFSPKAGLNAENVESLRNKHSGDLIGFIDLGDPMTNYACLDKEDSVATHALAFLVRGLATDMKHIIAYYFTGNVTSYQLMPIFWKVVSTLELSLDLWVIGLVNDGASPNRKLFNFHSTLAGEDECDVVYKTLNLFAPSRFVYFFADSPHLLKTARNCLYNSGSGSHSRYMWNNGKYLPFSHIADLFSQDQAVELHVLPKLTLDHITLTSYSKMKYLESWKASTHEREGDFSDDARGKMFLSMQTYEGLKISVFSHVEAIKFLLKNGFNAYEFGYNDLTIAAQRDIAPVVRGDVGGRYEKKKWFAVSDEPVQKRKKK
ncbi:Hypothetical predicted protein, partial [Paramuricea clavata]